MPLSAVVLDVGGVFLVPHPDPISQALTSAGIKIGDVDAERAHFSGIAALDEETGEGEDQVRYLGGYVEALGVHSHDHTRAMEALTSLWQTLDVWRHVLVDSVAGLRQLAEAPFALAVVSNSDGTVEERLRRHEICQIGEGPGVPVLSITDSTVIGVEKPDPRAFAAAVEAVNVPRDQIAYVGDSVRHDVRGAQGAGLVPIHFDPYDGCRSGPPHRHIRSLGELTV